MENNYLLNTHYQFELPPLPYAYDALEPYIDTLTMQLHHDRHFQTYVDNLNAALKDHPDYQSWSLEKLLRNINWLPEEIRTTVKNNAGGVFNHAFYFANMTPPDTVLSDSLAMAINATFGSYEAFQKEFKTKALSVFGSGYAWLVLDRDRGLRIITTANQDTPLALNLCPIMQIDVWEHAYYLKHYNVRADYIDDWFHIVNLDQASKNYARCLEEIG
jgi:Fe-Mn family superoxide dismutase